MSGPDVSIQGIEVERLIARLGARVSELGGPAHAALATDGDGTLWTGDVGEALFEEVLRDGLVGAAAVPALIREAERHAVVMSAELDPVEMLRTLWQSYVAQQFPEERMCAVMSWCMAGSTFTEVEALSRRILEGPFQLRRRLIAESGALVRWAFGLGIPVWLVSASPQPVVQCAATMVADEYGTPPLRVLAMTPADDGGVIQPATVGVLPYGDGKAVVLESELRRDARKLLCAMGDNVFDAAMLRAAEVAIAVRPKPALMKVAASMPGLLQLLQVTR